MTLLLKDPDAALDYAVDWGAEYLNGDTLAQSTWAITPVEIGGLDVSTSDFDATLSTATAQAGVPGHIYQLTNHVQFASGLADSRSIVVRVEKR